MSSHSQRQLYTIKTFGTKAMGKMVLHSGCFGCGKTYSITEGFGLYCYRLQQCDITGLNFILLGKTQGAVKKNVCNVLSKLYGENFKYDASQKSGIVKDAVLFGQNIYIVGLNDTSSETKIRGISDIMGIIHDESALCTKDQFNLIMSRLRGEINVDGELPAEFIKQWYIGSTNPDVPTHFLLDYVNKGIIKMIKWYMRDACWNGAVDYFNNLKLLYKDNPSFYARYLLGKWTSADRMVYCMFNNKVHVIENSDIDYKVMKRNFIGLDYGADHPTAILLISVNFQGTYIVSKEWKFNRTAPSDIVNKVLDIVAFLNKQGATCSSVYVDPSAVAIKDELKKKGINPVNALNSHLDGITTVQNLFSLGKLYIMDSCENLVEEIYSYRYKDTSNGKDEVIKLGDDFCDAMRYGVYSDSVLGGN